MNVELSIGQTLLELPDGFVLHLPLLLSLSGLAAVGYLEEGDSASGLVPLDVLHESVDIGVRFPDGVVNFSVNKKHKDYNSW